MDKLVNDDNVTTEDVNMWLTAWPSASEYGGGKSGNNNNNSEDEDDIPKIYIDLSDGSRERRSIAGIRIWNYNKSIEVTKSC